MRHLALRVLLLACGATAPALAQAPAPELGSLRNARVAVPRDAARAPLTYFLARELDAAERAELAQVAPGVRVVAGLSRDEALRRAAEAHGADASYATPEFVRAATRLAWVQAQTAGVERVLENDALLAADRVVLTNMRGTMGATIAEHAFAMLLALTRDLAGAGRERVVLHGRTLLVVGLGDIGGEIARRAHAFGMRVLATRRSDAPAPPFVERVGRPAELRALLPEADVVALAVPLTRETERMFDAAAFAAMKPGSYLVNVARGKVVDTGALLAALRSGKLAGAALDVTDPEPLPPGHPLRKLPGVIITPHVAARGALSEERRRALFRENLRRFDAGEPLLNVVDKRAGY